MRIVARNGERHLVELDNDRDAIYDLLLDRLMIIVPPITRVQILEGEWKPWDGMSDDSHALLDAVERQLALADRGTWKPGDDRRRIEGPE